MDEHEQLLAEFKSAFEAGEQPDPDELIARAPEAERQTLAAAIDGYLMSAPRRQWDPVAYRTHPARASVERIVESLEGVGGTWPELLPQLRKQAKVKRSELVERLAAALGVSGREAKVAEYYHEMEHGRLPAAGVSGRVLEALAEIVETTAEALRRAGSAEPGPETKEGLAFARLAQLDPEYAAEPLLPGPTDRETLLPERERDEVDELFTRG